MNATHEEPKKLSAQLNTRVDEATADRVSRVAFHLQWSEAQVVRWLIETALPRAERLQVLEVEEAGDAS